MLVCSLPDLWPLPPLKAVNRGKGLLPDPTAMQILTGLNNPATLKMLLNPLSQGPKQGKDSPSSSQRTPSLKDQFRCGGS